MFGEGGPYDIFREPRVTDQLDVTAEHLTMRADGGTHDVDNVVAARILQSRARSKSFACRASCACSIEGPFWQVVSEASGDGSRKGGRLC